MRRERQEAGTFKTGHMPASIVKGCRRLVIIRDEREDISIVWHALHDIPIVVYIHGSQGQGMCLLEGIFVAVQKNVGRDATVRLPERVRDDDNISFPHFCSMLEVVHCERAKRGNGNARGKRHGIMLYFCSVEYAFGGIRARKGCVAHHDN